MLMGGNPKVFGPVFCGLVLGVSLIAGVVTLINNPIPLEKKTLLENEQFWRAVGFLSIALLNLGALVIHRIYKIILILPFALLIAAIAVSFKQSFQTNTEILIFLSIFSLVFSIATASAKFIEARKVSNFGIYDVTFKGER